MENKDKMTMAEMETIEQWKDIVIAYYFVSQKLVKFV
jgi:hypothetical protein